MALHPLSAVVAAGLTVSLGQLTPAYGQDGAPVTGQPAADVLASQDLWGNPTFVGGITNRGPDSQSVW